MNSKPGLKGGTERLNESKEEEEVTYQSMDFWSRLSQLASIKHNQEASNQSKNSMLQMMQRM
jgi:hypothetical protein